MKKSIALLALPAFALLASCGGNKADVDTNTIVTNTGTMTDISTETDNGTMNESVAVPAATGQMFADTASASDAYEIAAGKLAASKATTKALKDFGQMMVDGHTHSTAKLKEAAKSASPAITPAGMMTPEQKANLATLESATGTDFDAAYKSQQVAAHTQALAAIKGYAASGDVASLKTWAVNTAPVVQRHLEKIQGM